MKKVLLIFMALLLLAASQAQSRKTAVRDVHDRYANNEPYYIHLLPKGAVLKSGKLRLQRGYKAVYTDNKRVVLVERKSDGGVTGAFSCVCERGTGSCGVSIDNGSIQCVALGGCNCKIGVVIKPPKKIAITQANQNWKTLILPAGNPGRQKTEDPDQGGEIIRKKDVRVHR